MAKKFKGDDKFKGVIAASAGNHALALSWHAPQLDLPVTVIMPEVAPLAKIGRCRSLGANVVVHGAHILEAFAHSQTPEYEGWQYLNGFDHPDIIAGAGTLGLEIDEQVDDIDYVVVPVGGAGLIAGVALALNTVRPSVEVLGVEPERCASYQAALAAGHPVDTPTRPTLADGLAVPKVGGNAFEVSKDLVAQTVSVNERAIAIAMLRLVEAEKTVIEGGGASGLAAILPGGPLHQKVQGKRVVVPLCGGNIDTTVLGRVLDRGLAADGRLVKFSATISDRPGGIQRLSTVIASNGASIRDILHERAWCAHGARATASAQRARAPARTCCCQPRAGSTRPSTVCSAVRPPPRRVLAAAGSTRPSTSCASSARWRRPTPTTRRRCARPSPSTWARPTSSGRAILGKNNAVPISD